MVRGVIEGKVKMTGCKNAVLVPILLVSAALAASNPQDEQVVRNAYAKLAYAVESKTVYAEAQKNAKLTSLELAQKVQTSELRFQIADMSSVPSKTCKRSSSSAASFPLRNA